MAPPLRAEADPTRPLGHARIVLRGIAEGGDLRFCLLREGYAAGHLGPRGWQVGEAVLEPEAIESEAGAPVLILAPRLVRHVEPGPLTLRLPALGRDLALFWPADIPIYDEGVDSLALSTPPGKPLPSPPAPKPSPGDGGAEGAGSEPPPRLVEPAPPQPQPRPQSWRRWPLLLLVAVLLAAAAAAAWWYFGRGAPPPPPPPPPEAALPPPGAPSEPAPPPWPEGTDGLSVREVVAQSPSAEGIFAVGQRRQRAGRYDDALVLFEEAADRGVAPALTALGRMYDPNGFRPGQPFTSPDLRQAADYYRRAELAGDTQVLPLRAALKSYLEAAAAQGNATAAEALREFWP